MHLTLAQLIPYPFFTTMIWQAQRRASPAPPATAAAAVKEKMELRALMVGGHKGQTNPKGQGPKPKEVAKQHLRGLCHNHSTPRVAKKRKMKTLPGLKLSGAGRSQKK